MLCQKGEQLKTLFVVDFAGRRPLAILKQALRQRFSEALLGPFTMNLMRSISNSEPC